jgi:hypothetical protein
LETPTEVISPDSVKILTLSTQQDIIASIRSSYKLYGTMVIVLSKPFIIGRDTHGIKILPVSSANPLIGDTIDIPWHSIVMMYDPKDNIRNQYKAACSGIQLDSKALLQEFKRES